MFISKTIINPYRSDARMMLSDPQKLHAAVMRAFSEQTLEETNQHGRPLWRLDESGRDPVLYITSPAKPDLQHIVEQIGRANDTNGSIIKDYSTIVNSIENKKQYRFKLKANPTSTVNNKIVSHITDHFLREWLLKKSTNNGFYVENSNFKITAKGEMSFKHDVGKRITLSHATYEGLLQVNDIDEFQRSVRFGVGKGKAYGLGMLSLGKV